MKRKTFVIGGLMVVLFGVGFLYYLYQQPRPGVTTVKAAFSLGAENIYQEFVADEAEGNQKYAGKVVEVRGKVGDVIQTDSTAIVLLAAGAETGGVDCSFKDPLAQPLAKGQVVTVKGRCTGFLMDVNLVDAVLVR